MKMQNTLGLLAILGAASVASAANHAVPPIVVNSLTHSHFPGDPPFDPSASSDGISIGDGNYSGGGGFTAPSVVTGDTFTIRLEAPAGSEFYVAEAGANVFLDLYWRTGVSDLGTTSGGSYSFENLGGSAPTLNYSLLMVFNQANAIRTNLQFVTTGPMSFSAIEMVVPVQTSPAAGPRAYGAVDSFSSLAFGAVVVDGPDRTALSIRSVPEPTTLTAIAAVGMLALRRRSRSVAGC